MTGQELIKKIEKENLQDRHLFIDVEGYISPVCEVLETKIRRYHSYTGRQRY